MHHDLYCLSYQFAADFVEKTLFKTIMVRLLKAALASQKENFSTVLSEEILNVDKQLLQVEKVTSEVSGNSLFSFIWNINQWPINELIKNKLLYKLSEINLECGYDNEKIK